LGVVFLFTAITVPLGIRTMGLEAWGIWVFCQQASSVICLFESFTQSAFVRLLIQVKDDRASEDYKRLVVMGNFSFCFQGLLLVALHAGFAALLPLLFPNFTSVSGYITVWILGIAGLVNQIGKVNGQLLYAHQHQDRASFAATAGLVLSLLILIACLPRYPHPQTMAWAFLASSVLSQVLYWLFARSTGCLPSYPGFPRIRLHDFQPLWIWGRRFFLYSLLDNLATNLPVLLAGRFLSLEMVGVWGVLQRIANMMSQTVSKISQLAVPALMEMHARGEETQFRKRSRQVLWVQNSLAGLGLGIIATGGDELLRIWLGKPIPLGAWVLPLFTLALLADFDQRTRFGLETLRLQIRRPTFASFAKVFLLLFSIPFLTYFYGLTGMSVALGAVYAVFLLPLSISKGLFPNSYSLSWHATAGGFAMFMIGSALGLLGKFFWA
jgi:O-antigen/teichoic acid export membrane protein